MPRPCRLLAGFLAAAAALSFAQTGVDDRGITVDPGAILRHRAPVHYPKGSLLAGTVEIDASLNASGEVSDARVVSGPEELRKEALWSVLQWHYAPSTRTPIHISIGFDFPAMSVSQFAPQRVDPPSQGEDFVSGILKTIEFTGLGAEAGNELRARLAVQEGDPVTHSDLVRITNIVREFDEHLTADITGQIAAPDAHRDLTIRIHAVTPGDARPAVRK